MEEQKAYREDNRTEPQQPSPRRRVRRATGAGEERASETQMTMRGGSDSRDGNNQGTFPMDYGHPRPSVNNMREGSAISGTGYPRSSYNETSEGGTVASIHYFAENEEKLNPEGVHPARQKISGLFDDFDSEPEVFRSDERLRIPKKRKKKHGFAWAFVSFVCMCLLLGMAWLAIPQLSGFSFRFLPNVAFVNGMLILQDEERTESFRQNTQAIYVDTIYPGVYIDGIHVGGMTKAAAIAAVSAASETEAESFDLVVTVGNQSWHVNNERVPITRNTEEVVEQAWALGRNGTLSAQTPFQDRVNQASSLKSYPVSLTTAQTWDHEALRTLTDGIVNYVNRDPVSSTVESFNFSTYTFTFTEDTPGAYIDADALYERIGSLLDQGVRSDTVNVVPEKILAEMTRTELMNSFGLISSYTTKTTSNSNRNTNIRLSAAAISGITVMPGETFSFNGATGERTAEKGYKAAAAISGGTSRDEIGGGVCQTSSTLFNAVARANLEIVDRSPHAWPSSYVEKGMDATVNWPGLDFKFKNNTEWPIFIVAGYADRKVTVNIYGMSLGADVSIELESEVIKTIPQPEGTNYVINTELSPGESKETVTGRKGYVVETWKVWYQGTKETKRELLCTSTYKAYQTTVEYNPAN